MPKIYNVSIRRDAQTTTPVTIPLYEVPILKQIFGEENVAVGAVASEDWSASSDEFDRLTRKYGEEVVEKVYGTKAAGGLENAIERIASKEAPKAKAEEQTGSSKDALIAQAKELGINATRTWGEEKLLAAIAEKQAELETA